MKLIEPSILNEVNNIYQLKTAALIDFKHKKPNGRPLSHVENFEQLLEKYKIEIKFNEMTKAIDFVFEGKIIENDIAYSQIIWKCNEWDLPTKEIDLMINEIAKQKFYHPARDWIESVPWDNVSRLQYVYDSVISQNPMKELLIRKWLISCVAALYEPRFSNEGALIFKGKQGLGKTTWLWSLVPAGSGFMKTGSSIDPHNKDSLIKSLSFWIVELGEITQTMKRNDINTLKAFLTDDFDMIRLPYAKHPVKFKRQTVFCGSTNEEQFLAETENRRFWCIETEALTQLYNVDVQQMWAEVKHLYDKSDKTMGKQEWFLSKQECEDLYGTQEEIRFIDPIHELLDQKVNLPKGLDYDKLNVTNILIKCGIQVPNRTQCMAATIWLKKNGFQRQQKNKAWLVDIPFSY